MDKTEKITKSATPGQTEDRASEQQTFTLSQAIEVGLRHHTAGDLSKAEDVYQQILNFNPNQPRALHLLGVIAHQAGKNDVAVDRITKALAIKPDYAEAHSNLGLTLKELGRLDEAVISCHNAIDIKPDFAEAHSNLGMALQELGKLEEAVFNCQKAIDIKPNYAQAHSNLGNALQEQGKLDEAITSHNKAIAIEPDFAVARYNLGNALKELGRLDEAVASYQRALAIQPNFAEAHYNLASTLHHQGTLEETVASYHKALDIKPDYAEAHNNLGAALQGLGKFDEAVASYDKALAINPDFAEAHKNLGITLLALGRFKEGLDELEWRWQDPSHVTKWRDFAQPMWDGTTDLSEKTIILWPEQGPQDVTIWASNISQIIAQAGLCIVEVQPKLVSLFTRTFPNAVVRAEDRSLQTQSTDIDFHLPLGSLYRCLYPNIDPPTEDYLIPDPERVTFWKKRLTELGPGPYVGISWKSPLITPARTPNYTQIEEWSPVFANRDVVFVNLQCGNHENDLAVVKRDFGVMVHNFDDLDLYDDLDDVAALSKALDIAISVSTAVAAITAGVGTPTWLLSWCQSAWNNILFAARGPSVTSFERNTGETWEAAFESMADRLKLRILE